MRSDEVVKGKLQTVKLQTVELQTVELQTVEEQLSLATAKLRHVEKKLEVATLALYTTQKKLERLEQRPTKRKQSGAPHPSSLNSSFHDEISLLYLSPISTPFEIIPISRTSSPVSPISRYSYNSIQTFMDSLPSLEI